MCIHMMLLRNASCPNRISLSVGDRDAQEEPQGVVMAVAGVPERWPGVCSSNKHKSKLSDQKRGQNNRKS